MFMVLIVGLGICAGDNNNNQNNIFCINCYAFFDIIVNWQLVNVLLPTSATSLSPTPSPMALLSPLVDDKIRKPWITPLVQHPATQESKSSREPSTERTTSTTRCTTTQDSISCSPQPSTERPMPRTKYRATTQDSKGSREPSTERTTSTTRCS